MFSHLRANVWLLGMTVLVCCVLYPFTLWVVAQAPFFRDQAEGSLVYDKHDTAKQKPLGARLIAQGFDKPEFFQPRPSAASYNAAASGASNLGANNYLLRDRVARTLGPIVKYADGPKKGQLVAPDIITWFDKEKPRLVAEWSRAHPDLAKAWVKDGEGNIAAVFFDLWRQEHPDVPLEEVPADLVMSSGSGLDPHITLANGLYQAPRVASARAQLLAREHNIAEDDPRVERFAERIQQDLVKLLHERAESQLFGLVGVPLLNVLELNLVLPERLEAMAKWIK